MRWFRVRVPADPLFVHSNTLDTTAVCLEAAVVSFSAEQRRPAMTRTHFPFLFVLACLGGFLLGGATCRADNYALLIGIDQYQQSDAINGLAGASNDAKGLAATLEQVSGFPADHVR